jgi:light-regulated signal transduction histidine kinase (bacteriophytochrome)
MSAVSKNELVNKLGEVVNTTLSSLKEAKENLEERIAERTAELSAVNRELETFVYSASHDLKEPLRAMESFSEFLLEDYKDSLDEVGRDYLIRISAGAERAKRLIDDLLRFSRITKERSEKSVCEIKEIVEEAKKRLEKLIEERGAEIGVEDAPPIFAERPKLIEVFSNLISNGIKYNRKRPKIAVGGYERENEVVIYVKDNGIGIEKEHFERIFQIFQRLHKRDEYGGGTGAGLAIVKQIVEQHKGRIFLESEPDRGSTFYIAFPKHSPNAK